MRKTIFALAALALAASCGGGDGTGGATNPFTEDQSTGKQDTGYLNMAGLEVHVTLEADVEAPAHQVFDAPAYLAQYAVTYLRNRHEFYIELLAEDAATPDRVEWLVDGSWITTADARKLTGATPGHFRLRDVSAVALNRTADTLAEGQVFNAKVPKRPYAAMADAGDTCAEHNSHITLGQSVYWYLWDPDESGCKAELQTMTVTVTELLPANPKSYPEYDRLWEDKQLSVVLVFGELDDGADITKDYNWGNADRMVRWLKEGGFAEAADAPLGRRFTKTAGELVETVDVYHPDIFRGLTDYANVRNWQKAVAEHEVVIYLGHSVLGTGYAYEEVEYPSFYQIFLIGGCLGYEYYVRPVLAGKKGWENVDAVSSIVENYYSEMNPVSGAFLAKLFWGIEHEGKASWQDIMAAVNNKLGHAHFGVSGARGNCFTPEGPRCGAPPDGGPGHENAAGADIPDNDPAGVISTIEVQESSTIAALSVAVDITHPYVGDLELILSHGGVDAVLWDREGGSQADLEKTFTPPGFQGQDAAGIWKLRVVDHAARDAGRLDRWVLTVTP